MANGAHSAKWNPRLTQVILALVGMTGLALFILACRPSWSPDGEKILYAYWNEGAEKTAVVVFDRVTRTSRVILEFSNGSSSSGGISGVQWTKDGANAIVTIYGTGGNLNILALPRNSQKPVRAFTGQDLESAEGTGMIPFPQVGNQLYVGGRNAIARVDLETGEIYSSKEKECLLYEAGGKVMYLRGIETGAAQGKKEEAAKKKGDEQEEKDAGVDAFEIGEMDLKDLSLHPTVTLRREELKARGIGEPSGLLDVYPNNLKIASTEDPLEGQEARVLLIGSGGIEQILNLDIKEKRYKLGNPLWSSDGKIIFVSALINDEKTKKSEFAVVELAVDSTSTRIDKIEEGPEGDFDSDFLMFAQIALSPDGKLIAVTSGQSGKVRPEREGLFVLDVSKAGRPVNFYPAPALRALPKEKKE